MSKATRNVVNIEVEMDLMAISEDSGPVARAPTFSGSLGGWSAKALQVDVTGYCQQYVESPPHDPKNLMFIMVTYGGDNPVVVAEITEQDFDRFASIEDELGGYGSTNYCEATAVRRAIALAQDICQGVSRHQKQGKKERSGGYTFFD